MHRERRGASKRILFIAGVFLLLAAGCSTSLVSYTPGERPTSVAPPTRWPIPTANAAPPNLHLSLSPFPLHGAPPFAARLMADLYGSGDLERACATLHWEFGEGTAQDTPCTTDGSQLYLFSVAHDYPHAGTYYARVTAVLQDGRTVESNPQTIVVSMPQPVSPVRAAVFWGLWGVSMAAAGGAFWLLRRRATRIRQVGYAALALALVTFVPPFSYLPNPVGFIWAMLGSYRYDPRLPFVNRFVIAGDPTENLRPYLDGLIGQTGLDPLDPNHPLAGYEFLEVHSPGLYGGIQVSTRLTYRDGRSRTYDIPLYQFSNIFGFYQFDWRYDGLGRLRTEHRELSSTPFGNASSSVRLATPQPLNLHPQSEQLDAHNPSNWGPMGYARQQLVWSPQGDAFLMTQTAGYDRPVLWLVLLGGAPPTLLAENVRDYAWAPDGRRIIAVDHSRYSQVYVISRDGSSPRVLTRDASLVPPGLTAEGIWYAWQKALWVAPYDHDPPRQVAPLPDLTDATVDWILEQIVVRPSPDGERVAYSCETKLCLQDRDGSNRIRTAVRVSEATWNPSGTLLAAVEWDYGRGLVLSLVRRDGAVERQITLAADGSAAPPQWTPDGKRLFVQTFPFNGRRILTVDVAAGELLDLSQPRWDAWFALAPDGKRLLLTNGRGGFWTSEVLQSQGSLRNPQREQRVGAEQEEFACASWLRTESNAD